MNEILIENIIHDKKYDCCSTHKDIFKYILNCILSKIMLFNRRANYFWHVFEVVFVGHFHFADRSLSLKCVGCLRSHRDKNFLFRRLRNGRVLPDRSYSI